jgi:hypothetical protein
MIAATTFLGAMMLGPNIDAMPALKRWMTAIGEREAVKRRMTIPKV